MKQLLILASITLTCPLLFAQNQSMEEAKSRLNDLKKLRDQYMREVQNQKTAQTQEDVVAAAETGDAEAQVQLGVQYEYGLFGVPKSPATAFDWYKKAATQGHAGAQAILGSMYMKGIGVEIDTNEAIHWYRLSALQGSDSMQLELALIYGTGKGIKINPQESEKWCRLSANQGNATAQYLLGLKCYEGRGTAQDFAQAYMWLILAAASDNQYTAKRDEIGRLLTVADRSEAQRAARSFRDVARRNSKETQSEPQTKAPSATGSGFFISLEGHIVTNSHVINSGTEFKISLAEGKIPAKVLTNDRANDLAILKIERSSVPLAISQSRNVRLGQTVATIGFPNTKLQGLTPKLARGEIASLAGARDDTKYFQISVPVQPGNSGGPLVDLFGNVVGVVTAKLDQKAALAASGTIAENVNYAVKSDYLLGLLESMPSLSVSLPKPEVKTESFEDVMERVAKSSCLVLVFQ